MSLARRHCCPVLPSTAQNPLIIKKNERKNIPENTNDDTNTHIAAKDDDTADTVKGNNDEVDNDDNNDDDATMMMMMMMPMMMQILHITDTTLIQTTPANINIHVSLLFNLFNL